MQAKARTRASPEPRGKPRHGATAGQAFPVVGIGASAGGLDAFKRFFSAVAGDCGIAFVLIQHLDPTRKSLTAELVGAATPMQVTQAKNGMTIEANHVYVIPPDKYLTIREGRLRVSSPTAPRSLRMAIDHFLRSLAADQHEKAIGIVLSGTGTDGTLGLKEIKAAGGMTMVQDPRTAQHDGMPRSAIAGGSADYILPPEQMGDALLAYVRHAPGILLAAKPPPDEAPDQLASIVAWVHARTKFDFSGYKKGTLRRRIQRRMGLRHVGEMSAYLEVLREDPAETDALFKDLLLKVTSFFREPRAWDFLQEQVIRPLVAAKHDHGAVRVWVPACATGEEAYSLAMVLIDELRNAQKSCRLQVFASDVDAEALEAGRAGFYPESIAADMSSERLARFFVKREHAYQVNKELREMVVFAQQNLITDPPFSKLDLISCRNLLIYLEPALQERLIGLLHFALSEGGHLFLGSAEGIGSQEDLFEVVSKRWRIYRRIGPMRHDRVRFPAAAAAVAPVAPQEPPVQHGANRLPGLVQQLLLKRYVPACVIINRNCEILYYHGQTDAYLEQPAGPPTNNVLARARNGLRATLRRAVSESLRSGQRTVDSGVRVRRGAAYPRVKITVEPLDAGLEMEGLRLVSFEDEPETAPSVPVAPSGAHAAAADPELVSELEYELKTAKDDLQHTIEDLKSANEELMSVNEELQSSNEELETSKEELQSLNEELSTSNTQLENKIGELEGANNDLDNLLTSTSIATLFLGTDFRIRRFTPAATRLFSLIPSDVGRPLADVVQKFTDPDLPADAAAVLEQPTAAPSREVQAHDGRWYVRQVLPYRTRDGRTEGVVITLSDVAAEALHEARLYAEAIVDTVREPLLVLDGDLRVISANRAFYSHFQVTEKETAGQPFYALGNSEWDIPQLRKLLGEVLPEKRFLDDFQVRHEFRALGPRVMLLNARALVRGGGRPELILLAIEDFTERSKAQELLRETETRKRFEEQLQQRQAQLAHALRISTVGELASGLAHELNQPLSAVANDVEACARFVRSGKAGSKKLLALLHDASVEALRAGEIVEHLRHFIRKGEPKFERVDLAEIVGHVPRVLGHELDRERIKLRLELPVEPLPIDADRIQIEQVVVNLMQNAIDSVHGAKGEARSIDLVASAGEGTAQVAVRDRGPGMSEEAARRLFEPFFTSKAHGLGLGLAISRSIIEAHQGRIWTERPTDGESGLTVRFSLPLRASKRRKARSVR